MWLFIVCILFICGVTGVDSGAVAMAGDYFLYKNVRHVCFLSCEGQSENMEMAKHLMGRGARLSVRHGRDAAALGQWLQHSNTPVGVLLDGNCNNMYQILDICSKLTLFDTMHVWLVLSTVDYNNGGMMYIDDNFQHLNLSVDADVAVALLNGDRYKLVDVYNFGKIQGNNLEKNLLGTWSSGDGLNISLARFKYYNRWDFHNLTLRAVSVIREPPRVFTPSLLEDARFTPGVSAMTKIVVQLLNVLKEQHNFRFNYTIVGRWVDSPDSNSTLAVTNSLFWRQQDISATCLRINPKWLDWVEPFLPPATHLETKFYYLIPDKGVGSYENRLVSPLSGGVWACAGAAGVACAAMLAAAAVAERRPQPALYAICSVLAALCQQAYEDGVLLLEEAFSSQSRRISLLVVGLTSMLLYNYYTSSVVSWLLSAAPPTIAGLDGLLRSELQLVFEDIGYTHQWLDNAGFFYYSGFKNPIEDELRDRKVTMARRTVPLMQTVEDGIELVRTGLFAYHTEPYTVSQVIGRRFSDLELCQLGALQVMPPSHVYVMGQKQSPYKQFFAWSLMRLLERGHTAASRARFVGAVPPCAGHTPRALALGQAAPAFALLLETYCFAVLVLVVEMLWNRMRRRR